MSSQGNVLLMSSGMVGIEQRQSRNLLSGSAVGWSGADYLFASIYYPNGFDAAVGDTLTIKIKGSLGDDRTSFRVYNSTGSSSLCQITSFIDGYAERTITWAMPTGSNTRLLIYQFPLDATSESHIERIMLVKGSEILGGWVPYDVRLTE